VLIADAQKVKGLAPLACKTDRIDSWVLAVLPKRDLVPALWLPDPTVRREQARCRPHVVKHRSMLKNRATRSGRQSTARRRIPRTRFDQRRLVPGVGVAGLEPATSCPIAPSRSLDV